MPIYESGNVSRGNPEQSPLNKIAEGDEESQKSFHRKANDSDTGKCLTWVTTGKEKPETLSSIVAVKTVPNDKFGKVLHFTHQKEGNNSVEFVCVLIFSHLSKDKESGLWWVNTSRFTETVVPVCQISKPLVTAQDDEDNNKLWILNYRKSKLDIWRILHGGTKI